MVVSELQYGARRQVYLNEFNLLMGNSTYLPLVSGILHANALQSSLVKQAYEFMPYNFHIDEAEKIIAAHENPFIAAFSVSMWNEQLSLKVAQGVKQRFPSCIIVFGGPQVPHQPQAYFSRYPFIDVTVKGEGEDAFVAILEKLSQNDRLDTIPGVAWRIPGGEILGTDEAGTTNRELDEFPSPYLAGLYDDLLATQTKFNFQAIIETNRGCPFKCTFCYWGMGGLRRKYRFHGLERVYAELEWMAKHNIQYVFNADSNFGMHRRDEEIAQMLVDLKKRYGYPEKFRTCYGKNTDERIFKIGNLLHEHQLEKGITISYQSVDPQVQINIKRSNIKFSVAQELQHKFNEKNVPVYTEMILGLPGETAQSWKNGINRILNAGLKNQLFLYICEVLPNTDLADEEYQKSFGIKSCLIELTEIHTSPRKAGWIKEYEDIVIETAAMSQQDWRRMLMFSWVTMLFHSLKAAFFIMAFLRKEYDVAYSDIISCLSDADVDALKTPLLAEQVTSMNRKADAILAGEGRGNLVKAYGDIYWEQEEVMLFAVSGHFAQYYRELQGVIEDYLQHTGCDYDQELMNEVFKYQALRMPKPDVKSEKTVRFNYNLPEYFETMFTSKEVNVLRQQQDLRLSPESYNGDMVRYCREGILWKRKNGNFLIRVSWERVL